MIDPQRVDQTIPFKRIIRGRTCSRNIDVNLTAHHSLRIRQAAGVGSRPHGVFPRHHIMLELIQRILIAEEIQAGGAVLIHADALLMLIVKCRH